MTLRNGKLYTPGLHELRSDINSAFDGFESGSFDAAWDINTFDVVTDRVYNGTYSAYAGNGLSNTYNAKWSPDLFVSSNPAKFEYYWQETSNGTGNGMRLVNSNGNVEVGVASDNPAWRIDDGNGVEEVFTGDGYDRWVRFTISNMDFTNGTFDVSFEDLSSGSTYTDSGRPLKQSTGVDRVWVEHYNGGWRDGNDMRAWYDDIIAVV